MDSFGADEPHKRKTVTNLMYDDDDNYDEVVQMRQKNRRDVGNMRLTTRMQMDDSFIVDDHYMGYDDGMRELMNQLPSHQLENVADIASKKSLRKQRQASIYHGTMRHNRDLDLEDEILETLKNDIDLEDQSPDNIDSALRVIPTHLGRKISIKHRLSSRRKKKVSRWKLTKYWFGMMWQHFKFHLRQVTTLFYLWRSHLMVIEGMFGTGVVSYFIFLKWVLILNIPIFLLTFAFLVIPQILYRYYQKEPPGYEGDSTEFSGKELLTGTGFFENSEMYYGFYTNETVSVLDDSKYQMKYAYLFTCSGYYLFCLILLGYSYVKSYRTYYIETGVSANLSYINIMFCGWPYGITSSVAAKLKHSSIYNELKEHLSGVSQQQGKEAQKNSLKKWSLRTVTWLLVLALLGGSGYATYIVSTELSIKENRNSTSTPSDVFKPLAMPVVISSIHLVIPMVFAFLANLEDYSLQKYELYIYMFRNMVLKATTLAVLIYFWFHVAATEVDCWETFIGQEVYRLVVVDLIFTLGYSFFMEFVRKLLSLKWENISRPEFAIGRNTLDLIYGQALCWFGVFYSPLLPVVVIVKLIIIFYVKRFSVVQNCQPALKVWRASSTHTIYVFYLFAFFVLTTVAVGCSILLIKPSVSCGPYKNKETSYDVVKDLVSEWKEDSDILTEIFNMASSPGFIAGVLVFISMVVYFTRAIMISHMKIVSQLTLQLHSERKDKRFLMRLLNQVRLKGRRITKHAGPQLPTNISKRGDLDPDGPKVFVKTMAETMMGAGQMGPHH